MIKRIILLLIISANCIAQQAQMNAALIKALNKNKEQNLSVLIQGNVSFAKSFVKQNKGVFKYNASNISSVILSGQAIQELAKNPLIKRIEYYESKLRVLDDTAIIKNNVLKIHNGTAPLSQSYDGTGVLFGMIDTGIDFTHPDFKDSTGKSRIKWFWAQGSGYTGGNIPQPFNYGQEWNNQKLDSGLSNFIDWGGYGHGTRVAGIAAGNGRGSTIYKGIAPKADIMCVAIDFNSTGPTISDAVYYLVTKADSLHQPLVINISLGDYYGSHDGQDLQAQIIDGMTANIPGRCVVAAAGNAGNIPFHLKYNVTSDTNFTCSQSSSAQFSYPLFADTANFNYVHYTIGVYDTTNFQYKGNIGFRTIFSCLNTVITDSIIYNGNRIGKVQTAAVLNNGTYELDISIIADSASYFWTLETTGSGFFDAWDFEYMPQSFLPAAFSALPRMTYYKTPDTNQTICTSFQCSNNVITVANYTERTGFTTFGGVFCPKPGPYDTLAHDCSRGPTRDGRIKPDIAATGDNIVSTGALWACQDQATNYPNDCNSSQDTLYMVFSGTSSAAPNVAGVALLYLQKNPTATNLDIKQAITNCAKQDIYTGSNLPNNIWGYGKLDGFGALTCSQTTAISQISNLKSQILVYPNPTTRMLNIDVSYSQVENLKVYDVLGNLIITPSLGKQGGALDVSNLTNGIYFIRIGNQTQKFIKN